MIMHDYKNHKPTSELKAIDYISALGFVATIITLLFVATI